MFCTLMKLGTKGIVLAAACFIFTAATPLIDSHAEAQTLGLMQSPRPGQSVETVGPAATVTSTVHYQVSLALTCAGAVCTADFPKPGAKRLITITRVSCAFFVTSNATVGDDHADVVDARGSVRTVDYLPINYANAQGLNIINQAIDLQVVGGQHLRAVMFLSTGEGSEGACTATGTLSTLQ